MENETKKEKKYLAQKRSILIWEDKQRTFWFWVGFVAGGVMGFYFASLYLLANFCT